MDGLAQEFADRLTVIRVDIQTEIGDQLTSQYNSRVTPTFILFDEEGSEQWRSFGSIDPDQVRGELTTP